MSLPASLVLLQTLNAGTWSLNRIDTLKLADTNVSNAHTYSSM